MILPRNKRLVVAPLDDEKLSEVIEVIQFDQFNTKSSGVEAKSWTRGQVVSVSDDCDHENGAKVGDVVKFTKNGGLPVQFEGRDFLLLKEADIMWVEEAA